MYNPNDYTRGMGGAETLSLERSVSQVLKNVYGWMSISLAITAVVAMGVASWGGYIEAVKHNSALLWGPMIAEIVIVIAVTACMNRLSVGVMATMLGIYAALNGLNLSVLFYVYTEESIATTFFVCAGTFAAMALVGHTTKTNMASWGKYFMMALFGIIIATIVNIFVKSEGLYMLLSYAGVLLFVGLTAYDAQKIKNAVAINYQAQEMDMRKLALMGSLILYLDFINLFIYLLRILGSRRN